MVWEYFEILRHLLNNDGVWITKAWEKKYSALIVIMSITVVETFINVFFRTLVENEKRKSHRSWIVADIEKRVSIEEKLRKWPQAVFGNSIDLGKGAGQSFYEIKKIRNYLVHLVTEHETVGPQDLLLMGMANTTMYDNLRKRDAVKAIEAAEGMIEEMLKLSGYTDNELRGAIHHWTGKPG